MLVAFSFCQKDESIALKNAQWIASLKNNRQHQFLLVHDSRCIPNAIAGILGAKNTLSVRDHWNKWPNSANAMFSQAARHIEYTMPKVKYWLFLEADAFPVQDYWLDKIEEEYLRVSATKKFMGAQVNGPPLHLSGVAVYPNPLVLYAGLMLLSEGDDTPFDLVDAENVARQSHFTDLIQNYSRQLQRIGNEWRTVGETPAFNSKEEFYQIATKECVLFHSDKFGKIPEIFGSLGMVAAETPVTNFPDLEAQPESKPKPNESILARSSTVEQPLYKGQVGGSNPPAPKTSKRRGRPVSNRNSRPVESEQPKTSLPKENTVSNNMIFKNGAWHNLNGEMTLQDHVKWLREYAGKNNLAKARVVKQLKFEGLIK